MLSWSLRRRIIYLAIVLVALGIVAASLYLFFQPVPSCGDGKRNQDELGVDCGGSCPKVCPSEILPLKPVWSRLFKVAANKYDIAALVKNPNLNHGAQSVNYAFRIWDKNNLLINITRGEAFLNPKEDLVLFVSRADVGKHEPSRIALELDLSPVWQKIDREPPKLVISGKRFTNEPTPRLSALVQNDSLTPLKDVQFFAVISDQEQNAIAVSSTLVDELLPGATRDLVFTWPEPFSQAAAFVDVSPHFDWRQLPE